MRLVTQRGRWELPFAIRRDGVTLTEKSKAKTSLNVSIYTHQLSINSFHFFPVKNKVHEIISAGKAAKHSQTTLV